MIKRLILSLLIVFGSFTIPPVEAGAIANYARPSSSDQTSSRVVALPVSNDQTSSRVIALPDIQIIHLNGKMDVKIISGLTDHDVRFIGGRSAVSQVQTRIHGRQLELIAPRYTREPFTVIIRVAQLYELAFVGKGDLEAIDMDTPQLKLNLQNQGNVKLSAQHMGVNALIATGSGSITLSGVDSQQFVANITGTKKVILTGKVAVQNLKLSGKTWFSAQWVQGSYCKVAATGYAQAQLAGKVGTFEMTLRQGAKVDAQYLRANDTYIKTYDFALAMVQTSRHQYTLARDSSNIYYYKTPFFQADLMSGAGSVLDFDGMA